jgi:hypothetical protein
MVTAISCVVYSLALSRSLLPTSCDNRDVPAMERPVPMEIKRKFTGQTKAVAAKWTEEILLTQIPSTRLYSVWIRLLMIMGAESVIRTL